MSSMEIEWEDWEALIEELSLKYEGWTAIVERVASPAGAADADGKSSYVESTLNHVSVELDGGGERLIFSFDDAPRLVIEEPVGLSLEESDEGEDDILEIESEVGTTRLRFRFPDLGEMRIGE